MVFLHVVNPLQIFGTLHIQKTGAAPDHEDLSDFFFEGEMAQSFFRPFIASGSIERRRVWMLVFRNCGQRKSQQQDNGRKDSRHAGTIAESESAVAAPRRWPHGDRPNPSKLKATRVCGPSARPPELIHLTSLTTPGNGSGSPWASRPYSEKPPETAACSRQPRSCDIFPENAGPRWHASAWFLHEFRRTSSGRIPRRSADLA